MAKPNRLPQTIEDVFKTTDRKNRFSKDGKEILNPTPMQPPLGYKPTLSLSEQIRQQVRLAKYLDDTEPETEEEADDFEIDEDPIIESRWENDMVPSIKETRQRLRELEELEKEYAVPTPPKPEQVPPEKKPEKTEKTDP